MDYQVVGIVLGALFFITGGLATLYKFMNTIKKERDDENQKILEQSKQYTDTKYEKLEAELAHQKNLHEGKLAELSDKIEHLREETRRYHGQLVELITKMLERE
jgi:uncharacterized coiled-coil protein SlyX